MRHTPICMLALLIACSGDTTDDTADMGDGDATGGGTDDGGTDSGGDEGSSDDGGTVLYGLAGKYGEAVVDPAAFVGTEEHYLIADEGNGQDVCRISVNLSSTGQRVDCADCMWAFDIVVSDATVVAESGPGCATDGTELNGTTLAYGYIPEWHGHSNVIAAFDGKTWAPADNAFFDEETGEFIYDMQDGYVAY